MLTDALSISGPHESGLKDLWCGPKALSRECTCTGGRRSFLSRGLESESDAPKDVGHHTSKNKKTLRLKISRFFIQSFKARRSVCRRLLPAAVLPLLLRWRASGKGKGLCLGVWEFGV